LPIYLPVLIAFMSSALLHKDLNTGLSLWLASNKWQREMNQCLAQQDLTHVQYILLCGIHDLNENKKLITQITLANYVGIDKMMTSKVVRSLEVKKLVKRTSDKNDKRAICIQMTSFGEQVLKKSVTAIEKFEDGFFNVLDGKQKSLIKKLKKIVEG